MTVQSPRRSDPAETQDQLSLAARLPEIVVRAAWTHRWALAPAYLGSCAAIGAGTGHALSTAAGLTGAAVTSQAVSRLSARTGPGRVLLSTAQWRIAAIALAGTGAWSGLVAVAVLPWVAEAGLLAGALAWPARQWITSRTPDMLEEEPVPSRYSQMTQDILDNWVNEITVGQGPRVMRGSVPIEDTVVEPAEGAMTVEMQLARGVPAKNVVSEANRRVLEALFGLPEDTVRLETVREDSTRFRVMITASRHLEVEGGLDWPGPELHDNGDVPLAVTGDGSLVAIPLYRKDGVRHGMITGTTGVGKSVSSVSVLLPGVIAHREVILYLDGKRGTSAPYLRPVIARYARMDEQWPVLIEIAHRILKDRELRRGALGLDRFDVLTEDDPIITVFIDEPNAVNHSAFFKSKHVRMVLEILEHGRALGVRLIECGQSPAGEDLIGGVQARGLMSGGWSINHRAGGKGASRLTLDSTNATISLLDLPEGGAAITVAGKLLAFPAQVRNATRERVAAAIDQFTPRVANWLEGTDLAAAGPQWDAAHWQDAFVPGYRFDADTPALVPAQRSESPVPDPQPVDSGEPADDGLPDSRRWVLEQLTDHPEGLTLGQLETLPGHPARRTITNALSDLMSRALVTKDGALWFATPEREAVDDPDE